MHGIKTTLSVFSIVLLASICNLASLPVRADERQAYVVNQAYLQIRRGPGNEYAIVKSLPNGSKLTIVNNDIGGGYAEIELQNGNKGYALNRYLSDKPPRTEPKQIQQPGKNPAVTKKAIQKKPAGVSSKQSHSDADSQSGTSIIERDQLTNELEVLRHTVANTLDIERQRNDLQERLVNLERNNRHLKLENQALQDKSSHDWFLLGAGVLLAGIILGWIFSSLGRNKKSSWDNF